MIPRAVLFALALARLLFIVTAHGGVSDYVVGNKWYKGYTPDMPADQQDGKDWLIQRKWTTIDPIFQVDNVSLACNYPGTPAPSSIEIAAGDNITAVYYFWLHPYGPMFVWMADCGESCATFNATEGNWFKIWEAGLISGTIQEGIWYQKSFQNWDGSPDNWTVTIPPKIKPGNYLIRHEILSIHIDNRPQFYPECAHLKVTGAGNAVPSKEYTAKIPGVWSMNDPSIKIDIYAANVSNQTTYKMPGPPVWTGDERHKDI